MVLTFCIKQLVLCGYLRDTLGHSLTVEDPLMLWTGLFQNKPPGGIKGHQSLVCWDFLWRNLSVQGGCGLRLGQTTRHHSRSVRVQEHELKVDGRWDEEIVFVWGERVSVASSS